MKKKSGERPKTVVMVCGDISSQAQAKHKRQQRGAQRSSYHSVLTLITPRKRNIALSTRGLFRAALKLAHARRARSKISA